MSNVRRHEAQRDGGNQCPTRALVEARFRASHDDSDVCRGIPSDGSDIGRRRSSERARPHRQHALSRSSIHRRHSRATNRNGDRSMGANRPVHATLWHLDDDCWANLRSSVWSHAQLQSGLHAHNICCWPVVLLHILPRHRTKGVAVLDADRSARYEKLCDPGTSCCFVGRGNSNDA
jgi:hypothetical protein